ncbi:MAG: ORF6N domain-containing protein [Odoribacteraceae bacterium]|jgi:cysteinyl-tRNA synthetase|nr:ORF6N domain-containing protein [Odoribacteraceae bacterium]
MNETVKFSQVEKKILTIRDQKVILDSDVADLYGVETKRINEAVKNNPDKFPDGYVIALTSDEMERLRSNFSTLENTGRGQHTKYNAKAFTEKGLYMLATILKSPVATRTTLAIVEAFAKIRELSRNISELSEAREETRKKTLMQESGEIISDLLGDGLQVTDTETTIEINFALMKFKPTIKRK